MSRWVLTKICVVLAATVIPRRENVNVIHVSQMDKDAIIVCYDGELTSKA